MIDYNQKYTLGELENLNIIKLGRGNVISKNDIRNNPGKYPVYSSSAINNGKMGEYGGYMFDDERITWSIDGGGKFFYRNNHKYSVTNVSGWLKVINSDILNTKFLYYLLLNEWSFKKYDYTNKAHPSVIRDDYILHIPSIDVQNEMVEVLDKFTELEAELEVELEARTKQYDYYIGKLYENAKTYKKIKIGDFSTVTLGATPSTKVKEYWENGDIPWMSSGEVNKKEVFETDKYITTLGHENSSTKLIPKNTVVVALAGQGKTRGTVAITRIELCTNQSLAAIITDKRVDSNYLYYYLTTQYENLRHVSSSDGSRGGLNSTMIKKYEVPVPPIELQLEIVSILDKFSSLVNDIKEGLPAEIELRRKQYEYYRNKLLTFE